LIGSPSRPPTYYDLRINSFWLDSDGREYAPRDTDNGSGAAKLTASPRATRFLQARESQASLRMPPITATSLTTLVLPLELTQLVPNGSFRRAGQLYLMPEMPDYRHRFDSGVRAPPRPTSLERGESLLRRRAPFSNRSSVLLDHGPPRGPGCEQPGRCSQDERCWGVAVAGDLLLWTAVVSLILSDN